MRKYEGLFILVPPADEPALEATLETIRSEITKLGGTVDAVTRMGRNMFARLLQKKESGFYVLIMFTLDPLRLAPLRERCKRHDAIMRAQMVLAGPGTPASSKPAEKPAQPATVA